MKKKTILLGALAGLMAWPVCAQSDDYVRISGSLIDWYYYGRDIHSGEIGWTQQPVGEGTEANPYNIGLITLGIDPGATDDKPVWVADFPIRNHILYSNCGGVYTGDAYYSFFGHEVNWESNLESEYGSEEYEILVRKWDLEKKTYKEVGKLSYQPTDLTYDPVADKVYGIFYTSAGYKLGELNMDDFSVRFISREAMPIASEFRSLAINSKGVLYGIDASGNVATINKDNGAYTFIGNMGFKTQRRMTSATFDFRTDKLYWIGFVNDGKIPGVGTSGTNTTLSVADGGRDTGVFEINTETGKADSIGRTNFYEIDMEKMEIRRYGKMQLTGIYVEGSFTKKENDLTATLASTPDQLKVGQTATVVVNVKNAGTKMVGEDDWKVTLYCNGEAVATKSGRDLEPGETRKVTFNYDVTAQGQAVFCAEVNFDKDEQPANNKSGEATVVVLGKLLPVVTLKGEAQGTNGLSLSWTAPDGLIIDGAEQYAAFSYENVGDWTMYDGDKAYPQAPQSYNGSVSYPNANTPKAYIVFNPEQSGIMLTGSAEQFRPYRGQQYFAAFYTAVPDAGNGGGRFVQNDDWMISPLLNGKAQTVTFAAKSYKGSVATGYETEANYPDRMRVLYSTTDTNPESFQVLLDTFTVATEWTVYQADLPEGAKHFALQCVSDNGLALLIDDVTFRIEAAEVKGYRLYRNGTLLKELGANELTYNVSRTRNTDIFTVTAVYDDGESMPSNEMGLDVLAGIEETVTVPTAQGSMQVFNLRGQRVQGMQRGGFYIVKQGGKTRKVMIK